MPAGHLEIDVEWLRLAPEEFEDFEEGDLESASCWRLHALTHQPVSWLKPSFFQVNIQQIAADIRLGNVLEAHVKDSMQGQAHAFHLHVTFWVTVPDEDGSHN